MTEYVIKTPNSKYSDVWNKVQFKDGVGVTQDASLANAARSLGYSVQESTEKEIKPSEGLTEAPKAKTPVARKPRTVKKAG